MTGEGGATTTPVAKPSPGTDGGRASLDPADGFAGGPRYAGPVKRSITIAGHETSVSLEPSFWSALERAAAAAGLPLSALVAHIDAERIDQPTPPNLASAIRLWLFARATAAPLEGSD